MKSFALFTLLILSSFCTAQDFGDCVSLSQPYNPQTQLIAQKPATYSYRVVFQKGLIRKKGQSERLAKDATVKLIEQGLAAYSKIANVKFVRGSSGLITIYVGPNSINAAGIQRGYSLWLNSRDPRGWSDYKVQVILNHEIGHMLLVGSAHFNLTFKSGAKTYKYLMHSDAGNSPEFFSPYEVSRAQGRWGKPVVIPPPVDPKQAKLKALRKERDAKKVLRVEHKAAIENAIKIYRANEDKIKELNEQIQTLLK